MCKLIWRHWTYKMPVKYILSSVWVRLSIISQWSIIQSIIQYVGLCILSLPTPLAMIERMYILCLIIIIKLEVWTITHCLRLGHETMVCVVCLFIFLLLLLFKVYTSTKYVCWFVGTITPTGYPVKHKRFCFCWDMLHYVYIVSSLWVHVDQYFSWLLHWHWGNRMSVK